MSAATSSYWVLANRAPKNTMNRSEPRGDSLMNSRRDANTSRLPGFELVESCHQSSEVFYHKRRKNKDPFRDSLQDFRALNGTEGLTIIKQDEPAAHLVDDLRSQKPTLTTPLGIPSPLLALIFARRGRHLRAVAAIGRRGIVRPTQTGGQFFPGAVNFY